MVRGIRLGVVCVDMTLMYVYGPACTWKRSKVRNSAVKKHSLASRRCVPTNFLLTFRLWNRCVDALLCIYLPSIYHLSTHHTHTDTIPHWLPIIGIRRGRCRHRRGISPHELPQTGFVGREGGEASAEGFDACGGGQVLLEAGEAIWFGLVGLFCVGGWHWMEGKDRAKEWALCLIGDSVRFG